MATVAVIDPSFFSLPYDLHLCEGLASAGVGVTLYGRVPRAGERIPSGGFQVEPWFYSWSEKHRLSRFIPKKVLTALKGLEHAIDSFRLAHRLEKTQAAVAHFQWMPLPMIDRYTVRSLQRRGIPVVFTVHDTVPFNAAPSSKGQNLGWRSNLELFDAIIVHTEQSKANLEAMRLRVPVFVIEHGLLTFGPAVEKKPADKLTFLFFGSIKPYKGLDILLHAFQKANGTRSAELLIVGNAAEGRAGIDGLVKELGIDDCVRFDCRFFDDTDVPAILSQADVVVFPYRRIDGSGALLTALAYGKPAIATNVGMFTELLADPFALVAPNSVESLAEKLQETIADPGTIARLQAIASRAIKKIPSWDKIGAATANVYATARSRRRS
ncbi:MAG TPA: glycosyltransferase [Terriglobales bacterium]|nr:glycosyltransferase [Terriglobales bacterium]